jgi:hypothetical protein
MEVFQIKMIVNLLWSWISLLLVSKREMISLKNSTFKLSLSAENWLNLLDSLTTTWRTKQLAQKKWLPTS